jgi:hypothetical protein
VRRCLLLCVQVAAVPLESRRNSLENYVLAQFSDSPTQGDFDDIRHSAGLKNGTRKRKTTLSYPQIRQRYATL